MRTGRPMPESPDKGRCARCHHPRGDHGGHSNLIFCYAHDAYHPSGLCDCREYEEDQANG